VERHLTRLTFGQGLQTDVTFSPDGRFIAYAANRSGNFDIWVQPVAGGEAVQVTRSAPHETQPDWSPDSSVIAFRSENAGGGIHLVAALGGPERRLVDGGYRPRFSPDGRYVLYLSSLEHETTNVARPDIYVVESGGGTPRRLFARFWEKVASFSCVDWHPDGKRVSFVGSYSTAPVRFFTVELPDGLPIASRVSGEVAQRLRPREGSAGISNHLVLREFRWSPSGRRLFFSGIENGLRNVWSIEIDPSTLEWRSGPERLTAGPGVDVGPVSSTDGRRLAFTIRDEVTRVWLLSLQDDTPEGEGEPISPGDFGLWNFDLSRDGRKLAFAGWLPGAGRTELWEVLLPTVERKLRFSDRTERSYVRYSHSAQALAFLATDNGRRTLRAIDESSPGERIVSEADMYPSDWTPDGTAIVGSTTEGPHEPWYVAAWPLSASPHHRPSVLLRDPNLSLWGAHYSQDGKWLCFNAHGTKGNSVVGVARAGGPPDRAWLRLTDGHHWDDKPRWSPDGRRVFYISQSDGGVFNLYRIRFDPERGQPIGAPVQITAYQSPSKTISPDVGNVEIGVAPGRVALSILEATGSIWMLDNMETNGDR
jgi:Tol biopolymer transport system component